MRDSSHKTVTCAADCIDWNGLGRDQAAENDYPAHQLVTRYMQNRDSPDWAIFVGKIIVAPSCPLSALCIANEVVPAIEAGLRQNPFWM